MFSNSAPKTLVASSSPMIRSAMLPSITFCCLSTSWMRAFSMSKSACADLLVRCGELVEHVAGLLDLGAHLLTTCLVLAISASKFCSVAIGASRFGIRSLVANSGEYMWGIRGLKDVKIEAAGKQKNAAKALKDNEGGVMA